MKGNEYTLAKDKLVSWYITTLYVHRGSSLSILENDGGELQFDEGGYQVAYMAEALI